MVVWSICHEELNVFLENYEVRHKSCVLLLGSSQLLEGVSFMKLCFIYQCACDFRGVIDQMDSTLFHSPCMEYFPVGCCGDASLLLGEFLLARRVNHISYVLGVCGEQAHAWLERKGDIIDITGDQFGRQKVFVGRADAFYAKFEIESQRVYQHFYYDSSPNNHNLLHDYRLIISKMTK